MKRQNNEETQLLWLQSYKRNIVLKKSKFVLNSLMVHYINLHYDTALSWSKLRQHTGKDLYTNLDFLKTKIVL
jgi:hypothetical protein